MDFNEIIEGYQKAIGHTVSDSLLPFLKIIFDDTVNNGDICDKILCTQQDGKI